MSDTQAKEPLPRLSGRALDLVKIFAAVLMVADHIDALWFDRGVPGLYLIGRGAFPLFCYAVAIAAERAGPGGLKRYAGRLLLFALAAQPVAVLVFHKMALNVGFTLAGGALCIGLLPRLKDWQIGACGVLAALSALLPDATHFGLSGVALPTALLLVMQGRRKFIPLLVLLLLCVNAGGLAAALTAAPTARVAGNLLMAGACTALVPVLALRLTAAYGAPGEGRLLPKYFLYAFYPLHLLALWGLKLALF